jgi:hypothetical protein
LAFRRDRISSAEIIPLFFANFFKSVGIADLLSVNRYGFHFPENLMPFPEAIAQLVKDVNQMSDEQLATVLFLIATEPEHIHQDGPFVYTLQHAMKKRGVRAKD